MTSFKPVMALSARAKALAKYLLDQQFAKLPECLHPYVPLLQKLSLGAATGVGIGCSIYLYLRQNNKPKLQLAIFHVLRTLENDPNLDAILQSPEHLAVTLEAEVIHMTPAFLTQSEGDKVLKELKRKVDNEELDLHRRVRPVLDDPRTQQPMEHMYRAGYGFIEQHQPQISSQATSTTTIQRPSRSTATEPIYSRTALAMNEDDEIFGHEEHDFEDDQQFTPYVVPTWQKSTKSRPTYETPSGSSDEDGCEDLSFLPDAESSPASENETLPMSAEAAKSGYGFSYDDWSDISSSDLSSSTSSSKIYSPTSIKKSPSAEIPPLDISTRNSAPKTEDIVHKSKKSLIDRAMDSAFDPNSPGNRHLPVSHFDQAEACGVTTHKGTAVKPRTALPRTPPTRGFLSANRDQILRGTSLSPVDEGNSVHREESSQTLYRVAESRKFYREFKAQRMAKTEVRGTQPVETPLQHNSTVQQARVDDYKDDILIPDELAELAEAQRQQQQDTPWESPILTFSLSDSGASVVSELRLDDTQSSHVSETHPVIPSPGTQALVTNPATTIPATPTKRGRGRRPKTAGARKSPKMREGAGVQKRGSGHPPKTPERVVKEKNVESVRQSARKTAYKGKFGQ
jgi:hypothetical protein